ncbi:cellulase family glycosylhydrolase [Paenibacillus sedimenti]|uniref:Cellulase family glycosylhydrolase n=1 Tax=Paenibacillus sedimenti TaxID=2770274 RepID=A0A926KN45_9BACL|nr:cellulase family glycosylhydrolase [Paenibacillus sedimenti]MBD0380897.1 cellulase family glycosylhydrolase [Paenibacillus sedimenti]
MRIQIMKNKYYGMLSLLLIVTLVFTSLGLPFDNKAEASSGSGFNPTVVRGFNTSAFTGLKRAKEVFGANVFRLQLTPRVEAVRSGVSITVAWQRQLDNMEGALQEAARQGMYVIVDLHEPPIADPSLKTNTDAYWDNDANRQMLVDCWTEIAQRFEPYRNNIWGYDLLNEPFNKSELPLGNEKWPIWAQDIVDAIRVYDQDTPIIYEASPGALPRGFVENKWIDAGPGYPVKYQGDFPLLDDDKVIYSVHMYNPFAYSHQGLTTVNTAPVSTDWPDKITYPGMIGTSYWDKNKLIQDLKDVRDFQLKYNVPIYVGEFSAIRWAPGAAAYTRDLIELFEEYGWSWTYHAYSEWHGWDVEYNEVMTSDLNRDSAIATEPTDRELVLKAYFNRNEFLPPNGEPAPPVNLVMNGTFEKDTDNDGLADRWGKDSNVIVSLVNMNGSQAQKIKTLSNQRGIDQAYFKVSDQNRYRLSAKIRVISGKIIFQHKDYTNNTVFLGNGPVVTGLTNTGGEFVTKSLEFVPAPGVARMSTGFWTELPSEFIVDDVELIDLGPAVPVNRPKTVVDIVYPGHLEFAATAYDGASIARTEYRIVGQSGGYTTVPSGGLTLSPPGNYIVAYRSVDTSGNTERAKSLLVDAKAPEITVTGIVYDTLSNSGDMTPIITVKDDLSGVDNSKTTLSLDGQIMQQGTTIPLYSLSLGTHTLVITATDLAGNTGSHTVTFRISTSISSLKELITRFVQEGFIDNDGIANSLHEKLDQNHLGSFVNEVQAQSGKHISSEAAAFLLRDAQHLLNN